MGELSPKADLRMDFPAAMAAVVGGQRVRRQGWPDPSSCVFREAGYLRIRLVSGQVDALLVTDGDLDATDWVVVRDN